MGYSSAGSVPISRSRRGREGDPGEAERWERESERMSERAGERAGGRPTAAVAAAAVIRAAPRYESCIKKWKAEKKKSAVAVLHLLVFESSGDGGSGDRGAHFIVFNLLTFQPPCEKTWRSCRLLPSTFRKGFDRLSQSGGRTTARGGHAWPVELCNRACRT